MRAGFLPVFLSALSLAPRIAPGGRQVPYTYCPYRMNFPRASVSSSGDEYSLPPGVVGGFPELSNVQVPGMGPGITGSAQQGNLLISLPHPHAAEKQGALGWAP